MGLACDGSGFNLLGYSSIAPFVDTSFVLGNIIHIQLGFSSIHGRIQGIILKSDAVKRATIIHFYTYLVHLTLPVMDQRTIMPVKLFCAFCRHCASIRPYSAYFGKQNKYYK